MEKKTIIFDLDGTLYELKGGSYDKSPLKTKILNNAQKLIKDELKVDNKTAISILKNILNKYNNEISIGLEKEYKINRYKYFSTVWNIPTRNIVNMPKNLNNIILSLSKKYKLILLSDAPKVWINNVLIEMNIIKYFKNNIYSGEGNLRKGFNNSFINITKILKINPKDCISVGDQEHSDIIPAKKIGIKTIFISKNTYSKIANRSIKSINELPITLTGLFK